MIHAAKNSLLEIVDALVALDRVDVNVQNLAGVGYWLIELRLCLQHPEVMLKLFLCFAAAMISTSI